MDISSELILRKYIAFQQLLNTVSRLLFPPYRNSQPCVEFINAGVEIPAGNIAHLAVTLLMEPISRLWL